jgi:hypothetical protein
MIYRLLIQYPERNPQDYEDLGMVDLDSAIKLYNKFNWLKQFKQIEKREESNLSSPYPEVVFQNAESNERLSIIGTQKGEYDITYESNNKIGIEHISSNFSNNPSGISVQDLIITLYQQELEAKFQYQNDIATENILRLGKYNPLRYKKPFIGFLFPIVLLVALFLFPKSTFNKSMVETLAYAIAFMFILNSPSILIFIQYLSKPKVESVILTLDAKSLQINYVNYTVTIKRTDIVQCSFTYCNKGRTSWEKYANISILLKDKSSHYLTTISFSREELQKIIESINVNTYQFDTSFQFLKTRDYSKKPEIDKLNAVKEEDLEVLYSGYTDKMLHEIVENPDDYQSVAFKVASKEIKKRKNKNFC